jgi:hypothetical protein
MRLVTPRSWAVPRANRAAHAQDGASPQYPSSGRPFILPITFILLPSRRRSVLAKPLPQLRRRVCAPQFQGPERQDVVPLGRGGRNIAEGNPGYSPAVFCPERRVPLVNDGFLDSVDCAMPSTICDGRRRYAFKEVGSGDDNVNDSHAGPSLRLGIQNFSDLQIVLLCSLQVLSFAGRECSLKPAELPS